MGLLLSELNKESEKFINTLYTIEMIARKTEDDIKTVVKYLLNKGFVAHIETYIKNDMDIFCSDDDFFSGTFQKTYDIFYDILNNPNYG